MSHIFLRICGIRSVSVFRQQSNPNPASRALLCPKPHCHSQLAVKLNGFRGYTLVHRIFQWVSFLPLCGSSTVDITAELVFIDWRPSLSDTLNILVMSVPSHIWC